MKKMCSMHLENRLTEEGEEIFIAGFECIITKAELQKVSTDKKWQVEIIIPER